MNIRTNLFVLFVTLWIDNSVGDCCGRGILLLGTCEDGTHPGLFGCCGCGKCNIFCCDCDGGCRKSEGKTTQYIFRCDLYTIIHIQGVMQQVTIK